MKMSMGPHPPVLPPLERLPSAPPRLPASGAPAGPSRLGWLDALRGIAALVVVFDHSSYAFMAEFRRELMPQFNTSRYGIMVFFLVSGYIIPASLERRGCVRTFWIGRVFRMYPLWAAVVTAVLALNLLGVAEIRADFGRQSAATVAVAHVTLLQELLGTPNLLLVLWTLSYEMAFYLLVVALFTVRLHQRSAAVAVTLAVLAAVSVTAGVMLPASALSGAVGTGPLVALASIAMVVAICCASAGSPALRVFGGVLGGVLALVLVPFNGTVPMWEGLVILAVMFLGTAVHRAETRSEHLAVRGLHGRRGGRLRRGECVRARRRGPLHTARLDRGVPAGRAHLRCRTGAAPPADTALADRAGNDQLLGLPGASGAAGGERRHDRPVAAGQSRTRSGVLRRAAAAVRADLPLHRSAEPDMGPEAGTPRSAAVTSALVMRTRKSAWSTPQRPGPIEVRGVVTAILGAKSAGQAKDQDRARQGMRARTLDDRSVID